MQEDDDQRYEPLDPNQPWDDELANDLLGSTLLVGITHLNHQGDLIGREQVFGTVASVSRGSGIKLIQSNGEACILAPFLDAIEAGDSGPYQLSDDDELVENPDFVAWVDAIRPQKH